MSQYFQIHKDNPQSRLIRQAADIIRHGGVIVYPTDSGYALGCGLGEKGALDRIREIRQLDSGHNFTLMCRDLSELSTYAVINNAAFRLIKAFTPGAYTFILPATAEVPRRLRHPKRKTIGIRVPDNSICLSLLEELEASIMSVTLTLPGVDIPLTEPDAIKDLLGKRVDLIIDGGPCGIEPTSVIDFVEQYPQVIRRGKGDTSPFE